MPKRKSNGMHRCYSALGPTSKLPVPVNILVSQV